MHEWTDMVPSTQLSGDVWVWALPGLKVSLFEALCGWVTCRHKNPGKLQGTLFLFFKGLNCLYYHDIVMFNLKTNSDTVQHRAFGSHRASGAPLIGTYHLDMVLWPREAVDIQRLQQMASRWPTIFFKAELKSSNNGYTCRTPWVLDPTMFVGC